jgi:hypothetical protein
MKIELFISKRPHSRISVPLGLPLGWFYLPFKPSDLCLFLNNPHIKLLCLCDYRGDNRLFLLAGFISHLLRDNENPAKRRERELPI